MSDEKKKSTTPIGRPLAVDHTAVSASQTEPAFIAPPPGAPVYHGFQIVKDVIADGFTFGKITDFEAAPCEYGDAFVIAPDHSRAGLVWEVSDKPYFQEVCPWNQAGGAFGMCLSLTQWKATTMSEEISNQYFLNSRSDGRNGVKSTRRREGRPKQRGASVR
jgi:hypothetical protein